MTTQSEPLDRPCTLCDSWESQTIYPERFPPRKTLDADAIHYQYHVPTKGNQWHFRVVQCSDCGHRYASKVFDQETMEGSYLDQTHDNEFDLDPILLKKTNDYYATLVEPHLSNERGLQVDVGCDTGNFLKSTLKFGFKRVVGIEPGVDSARAASEIPGVEVLQKVFDPADFEDDSVDFMSLVHVLDHLVKAKEFVRMASKKVKPGGVVFAVVHNVDSRVAKISGESWAPFNLVHMEYFTPATLRRLFEQEGYTVKGVYPTANYFPLSHLIRFAPHVPDALRKPLVRMTQAKPLNKLNLGLKLGNIGIVAVKQWNN